MGLRQWLYQNISIRLKKGAALLTMEHNPLTLWRKKAELAQKTSPLIAAKFYKIALRQYFRAKKTLQNPKSIVILMPCKGIGDRIIFSGIQKSLSDASLAVYVVTKKEHAFLYENDPCVRGIIHYDPTLTRKAILQQAGTLAFDLCVDFFCYEAEIAPIITLLDVLRPRCFIVYNDEPYYRECADATIAFSACDRHIARRGQMLIDYLGLNTTLAPYYLYIPQKNRDEAKNFLQAYRDKRMIVFNPFASNARRSFSLPQIELILKTILEKYPHTIIVLIGEAHKLQTIVQANMCTTAMTGRDPRVLFSAHDAFFTAAALVGEADIVISCETSIVHVSNVFKKPLVSVYAGGYFMGYQAQVAYAPDYDGAIQLCSSDVTGSDWADVDAMPVEKIMQAFDLLYKKIF